MGRLLFFVEDRLAQLRWTREDLAGAGGPAPSTLYKAAERGGGLSVKTLARLDVALGWQEGSAKWTLTGGSPALRISDQLSQCAVAIDAARLDAESTGVSRTAAELKNFLLDVAQRLGDFYTDPVPAVGDAADARTC
ncbi:hypothetical protein A5700_23420 [Mycobacterium sp. E1214]|nr:hypothetical protein A5700_23420 [Mycobacterium sp. E1214]OBH31809.1 hypothetical protein A5693_01460 [Mycobacterium sp. E1319]